MKVQIRKWGARSKSLSIARQLLSGPQYFRSGPLLF